MENSNLLVVSFGDLKMQVKKYVNYKNNNLAYDV